MSILEVINKINDDVIARLKAADSSEVLEEIRIEVLGKAGTLTAFLRSMDSVPPEERASVGKAINKAKKEIEYMIDQRKSAAKALEMQEKISADVVDITLPGRARKIGTRHLISRITDEICEIFYGLGYSVISGPEIETKYYNFTALNAPEDHPSRSVSDTFYIKGPSQANYNVKGQSEFLLRTQTSCMQVRTMESQKPPIYIVAPGRVYRRDIADPSHLPQFTQIEGLVVDKGITFGDLKGTLEYFVREMFGPDLKTRFRAHYFPFTEPSAEVDVSCGACRGEGCRFCKGTGWSEVLGCGMVDPHVYGYCDIDPNVYSGFAFGMGVERLACLKNNVRDLRMLLEGDMRFLDQF
ncbi:MAG: phenylalanine--tRNA ligase subunit alpha [Eggerthellaceae bacterium]|nr:phenylalanine--tRNA ligase subunit alpha [Eggerthellaceae bacterium]